MTQLDLDAIEARATAATPGPWEWGGARQDCLSGGGRYEWEANSDVLFIDHIYGSGYTGSCETTLQSLEADRKFIAHAREDVPALVQRVRELEREVVSLRQSVDDAGRAAAEHGPFGQ